MRATHTTVVKSAGRALAVLEYFDDIRRAATAAEIRRHLNIPASSATVLLRSLISLGYLSYDSRSRTYAPTLRVALLGDWLHVGSPKDRRLYTLVEELGYRTGQLVVLGARCGLRAQYVHVVRTMDSLRRLKRGTFAPLTRTSVGWVLMSTLPDRQVASLVTRINEEEEPSERVSPQWLLEQVHEVRRNGYAFCFGRVTPGVGAIGMRLPCASAQDPVVLAVSGTGEAFIAQKEYLVHEMRAAIQHHLQDAH